MTNFKKISDKILFHLNTNPSESIVPNLSNSLIKEYLKSILDSNKLLGEISKRSYQHENGFKKIVLDIDKRYGYKIRLHYWDKGFVESDIHNHAWSFYSQILKGKLINSTYVTDQNAELLREYKYSVNNTTLKSKLDFVKLNGIKLIGSNEYLKGEFYVQNKKVLHRVSTSKNESTVTFMVHQKPENRFSVVFKSDLVIMSSGKKHRRLTKDQVFRTIKTCL